MRKIQKCLLVCLVLGLVVWNVQASEETQAQEQLEQQAYDALKGIDSGESFSFYDLSRQLTEEPETFCVQSVLKRFVQLLLGEIYEAAKVLTKLMLPILLFGILQTIQWKKNGRTVSNVARMACYAVVCGVCITIFYSMVDLAQNTLTTLDVSVKGLIPVLFSVLATGGGLTQAAVVQPTILIASQILAVLIHQFLFPMILFGFALTVTDHFSENARLKLFGELLYKIIKWVLIFSLTIFVGIITVQSIAGSSMDAVKLKGAKYAVNTFVPLVGGALAEALESIGGSVLLIKNTTGMAGIIGIVLLCLVPLIKIFAVVFLFRLSAAVCQPVSDERFCALLGSVADSISLIGICILCMAVIFILSIAITIGTANSVFFL